MWPTHYIPNQPKIEGIPPPQYVLTTPPYPIEILEDVASAGDWLSVVPGIGAEDEVTSTGAVISGTLVERLVTYNNRFDEIESTGLIVSGTLVERLVTYDNGHDEVESTGAVISGILRDPLVVYDNWPLGFAVEDLQSSGAVISGVLA